jgi:cytochrome P450
MPGAASGFDFDPYDPAFQRDPYRFYKFLYNQPPMLLDLAFPTVLLARYSDVVTALRDPQSFSSTPRVQTPQALIFGAAPTLILTDPPVHTRLRRLVGQAFAPRRMREIEPRIRQITDDLLAAVEQRGSFDAIADLAAPLPTMVIAEILGVPANDYPMFKAWSGALLEVSNVSPDAAPPAGFNEALAAERAYFNARYEELRRHPGTDLMSALIQAEEKDALTFDEVAGFFNLLLLAGNETTANLIGNGLYALMRHPDQLALLRRNPALLPSAIEEILRWDSPVQATGRHLARDCQLGETWLSEGKSVVILNGAANRDPAQFPDPDRFDIAREPNAHLALGEGIHFCLGAALARLEGATAIGAVLARFEHLSLLGPDFVPAYRRSFNVRGLIRLPLSID